MKFGKRWRSVFGIYFSVIVAITLSARATYPGETTLKKVTIAYTSFSPSMLRFFLEKELGFYREEGLRPEFILVRGGGVAVKGLIAGNFDYIVPTGPVADAIIRGRQPLKIVLTAWMSHYWLIVQPEIRSVADLKGKTIGTASPGSVTDFTMREVLRQRGLDPLKDATFLGVGASLERLAALTSGAVHATLLSLPFNFKAVEMGYRKLVNTADYVKWPAGGLGTREEKVVQDPQEVSKTVRASLKGHKFFLAQREYMLSKMMQMFRLSREDAIQTYEAILEESLPSGYHTEEAERAVISMIKQAADVSGDIPPERVFDNRFVKQVEQELRGWKPQMPR